MSEVNEQVIIGNGAAGLSAVKAIRQKGWAGRITLISAEKCNAYSPVLTTYYISGKIGEGELFIADEEFYRRYDVNLVLGNKVTDFFLLATGPLTVIKSHTSFTRNP